METCRRNAVRRRAPTLLYAALAPIPLSTFAGEPSQNVGKSFLKSYAAVCLEGSELAKMHNYFQKDDKICAFYNNFDKILKKNLLKTNYMV